MQIENAIIDVNFHVGRHGHDVDTIVIHVTEGDADSVMDWFSNPKANNGKPSNVSAHYEVKKDGGVVQFVDEDDEAFANGRVHNPTAKCVEDHGEVNPNYYTISIEHEGDGTEELTDPQRASSVELINDIRTRHPLVLLDRDHIVGHHEIYSLKSCPGAIDVDLLVQNCIDAA